MVPYKKKYLGQHFLHDQNVIAKIIKLIAPKPNDQIIEIGPGDGALTTKLLPLVNSLEVIELDQDLLPLLKKKCHDSAKLHIHVADVLQIDFAKFKSPMRIVGNLPYNIATPLLFHLIKYSDRIIDLHFMLQKEVAERIIAAPGSKTYGRLSVMIQYYCQINLLFHVGSGAFAPPPKVESAFIKLAPHKHYKIKAFNEDNLNAVVSAAFGQRRKTIGNSLKKFITGEQLKKIGIDPKLRAEQLQVEKFVMISNSIAS